MLSHLQNGIWIWEFPLLSLLTISLYEYEVDYVLFYHRGVEMGKPRAFVVTNPSVWGWYGVVK